ncbi:hypothetical protein ABK040_015328 [Willaertia magna]
MSSSSMISINNNIKYLQQYPQYPEYTSYYCTCLPRYKNQIHYNEFIAINFRQCVYSNNEIASYIFGLLSILISMISLFPQIIKNFAFKKSEALSIYLFVIWFVGDITNLLGCILTGQLLTQILNAIYYCCMDITIILQYFSYSKDFNMNRLILKFKNLIFTFFCFYFIKNVNSLQNFYNPPLCENTNENDNLSQYIIGSICAWISSFCYIFAYLPQIYKNYKRKSVEGLSILTFMCDTFSQLFYILSICLFGISDVISTLPYIIGSVFTLIFSFVIVCQFYIYKKKQKVNNIINF